MSSQEDEKVKLLLLGTGESGKSTIFKQMRILYGAPPTPTELSHFSSVIRGNCVSFLRSILAYMASNDISPASTREAFAMKKVLASESFNLEDKFVEGLEQAALESAAEMKVLWASASVREVFDNKKLRSKIHLMDTHLSFMEDFDRIIGSDFVPSQEEMLMSRTRTVGFRTERYDIDGVKFEMYDVGGQRYFRKKWLTHFDSVDAIVFVASLNEYDQVLVEDSSKNRMCEAIELFGTILNNEYFSQTSLILFLNKKDLFEDKIRESNIGDVPEFQDFSLTGKAKSFDDGVTYFIDKFLECNFDETKDIYYHITCATDTSNISFVWESCRQIILEDSLKKSGLH